MNILVIPTTDWTRHPVPNRLNFIFDILAEKHEVHVADFTLKKFKDEEPRPTKCHLHNMTLINTEDPTLYYLLNSLVHLIRLRKIIRDNKIDLIVSANILPAFSVYFVKGKVPVVFDYLDHFEESASTYYPNSWFGKIVQNGVRWIIRFNLTKASSAITVTDEFKLFLNSIGVTKVFIIPNGVDTEVFKQIPSEAAKEKLGLNGSVIGYVGSLEYWIDMETVIEALPELDVTLLIVGPGLFTDYGDMIKKLADKLGVSEKIIFTGKVEYNKLYEYICSMDIGLNPLKHVKKNEITVGGKIFNYLACGKPVLSSRMVALENLMGNNLYYYDDKKSFIEMTHKLLEQKHDEDKYINISRNFDWKNIAKSYDNVLKEISINSTQKI
jgi:glycosyltransferase involved in cell wall biosynthesis